MLFLILKNVYLISGNHVATPTLGTTALIHSIVKHKYCPIDWNNSTYCSVYGLHSRTYINFE